MRNLASREQSVDGGVLARGGGATVVAECGQRPEEVPAGRRLELPGRGRTWVREAEGPDGAGAVVLLHGLGATAGTNWAAAFPALARRYRVVAMDHRGHGRGIRTRRFRLTDCADDVAALVAELQLDHPILVGYSMGGPIAALAWRRHPDLCRGLVFCATSCNFRGKPAERIGSAALATLGLSPVTLPGRVVRAATSLLSALPLPGAAPAQTRWALDELGRTDVRSVCQAIGQLRSFDSSEWISEINVPTAVVTTLDDRLVPLSRQTHLALSVPTAVIHPVATGHIPLGWLSSNRLAECLVGACRQVDERAARHPLPYDQTAA